MVLKAPPHPLLNVSHALRFYVPILTWVAAASHCFSCCCWWQQQQLQLQNGLCREGGRKGGGRGLGLASCSWRCEALSKFIQFKRRFLFPVSSFYVFPLPVVLHLSPGTCCCCCCMLHVASAKWLGERERERWAGEREEKEAWENKLRLRTRSISSQIANRAAHATFSGSNNMLPLLLLLLPLLATVANVLSTEFALTAAAKIFHFKFAMREGE